MQFSPSLWLCQKDCNESILKPLLATKYFTRTLQRCDVDCALNNDLLQALSKVQSLTKLDLGSTVENHHLEIIVNSFPSLETLTIGSARWLATAKRAVIDVTSPSPPATKTLKNLTMTFVDAFFATQFVPHFTNLRKLDLRPENESQELNLLPLSASLPLLTDLSFERFSLDNIESLNNLVHLSRVRFYRCDVPDLSFLTQANSLLQLTTLCIEPCGLSTSSFASLAHVPNLHVLEVFDSEFNNDCFQYLENMVHLRKLDLSGTNVTGDSRSLKTLMQNLINLEELNLGACKIGSQGAIAGTLYNTHSQLRVLNLIDCGLLDDDLNGIGALRNTLEALDLESNCALTNEALMYCKDLLKLKTLNLRNCIGINDLSPLKDCWNVEELNVSLCDGLIDDSFKVFSEFPNSFPNLQVLHLSFCYNLTEEVFEHLSKNNHLVYQLTKLDLEQTFEIASSSATARKNICQLKGLRGLYFNISAAASPEELKKITELTQGLKNLEE